MQVQHLENNLEIRVLRLQQLSQFVGESLGFMEYMFLVCDHLHIADTTIGATTVVFPFLATPPIEEYTYRGPDQLKADKVEPSRDLSGSRQDDAQRFLGNPRAYL